jgi:hypothetical protein
VGKYPHSSFLWGDVMYQQLIVLLGTVFAYMMLAYFLIFMVDDFIEYFNKRGLKK